MKNSNFSIKKNKKLEDALKCIELNGIGLIFIEDRKKNYWCSDRWRYSQSIDKKKKS